MVCLPAWCAVLLCLLPSTHAGLRSAPPPFLPALSHHILVPVCAEIKRWEDIKRPGSQAEPGSFLVRAQPPLDAAPCGMVHIEMPLLLLALRPPPRRLCADPACLRPVPLLPCLLPQGFEAAFKGTGTPGYPGGPFNPLGLGNSSKEAMDDFKWKEIRNGRLAMVAFLGFAAQHAATGFGGQRLEVNAAEVVTEVSGSHEGGKEGQATAGENEVHDSGPVLAGRELVAMFLLVPAGHSALGDVAVRIDGDVGPALQAGLDLPDLERRALLHSERPALGAVWRSGDDHARPREGTRALLGQVDKVAFAHCSGPWNAD